MDPLHRVWGFQMRKFWNRRTAILASVILAAALRLWAAWQLPVDFDEPVYLNAGFDYAQAMQNRDLNALIRLHRQY